MHASNKKKYVASVNVVGYHVYLFTFLFNYYHHHLNIKHDILSDWIISCLIYFFLCNEQIDINRY